MRVTAVLLAVVLTSPFLLADDAELNLDKIEASLKSKPNDPMLHYRKCQALFANGKEQEAVDHASIALEKFKAAKASLAWMMLGSFKTDKYKIDVHYNMGPQERNPKKDGIVNALQLSCLDYRCQSEAGQTTRF